MLLGGYGGEPHPERLPGGRPAGVSHPGGDLTRAELRAQVSRAAHALAAHDGRRIAIEADDALGGLCWFLGAELAGAAALIVEPTWTAREREAVLDDARPAAVVTGAVPTGPVPDVPAVGDADTPFYLPTTSGSSGRPKVLVRSRRSWLDSFAALDLGLRADDVVLIPGPLSSSLFLFGAVHTLHGGAGLRLLERWSVTEAAEACRTATVVHLVPSMIASLLPHLDPADCALRLVVCGGAKADPALRRRLEATLPDCELVAYYGSAEHSFVAVDRGDGLRPVVEVEIRGGDVGRDGHEVGGGDEVGDGVRDGDEIRDGNAARDGNEIRDGHAVRDGELWTRSGLVFDGYLDRGAVTWPADWHDGWSSVGDRAVLHDDGTLEILGRSSAVLNSGGRIVSAEEVEEVLRGAEGVRDVLVAATPHPRLGDLITAVVEVGPAASPLAALRERARTALEPAKRPRRWLATAELPRTAAGKPARALVAERLRDGTLAAETLA
ncbi:long-chain acyl-CoA synthetase [Saccharopolyspora erythraea NRRL 2338]|uniref:Acyl-CoA synthase n=3 Tax=Saccharopolyspora erythraea TaxID=1836 RepID=A4F8Z4_SACEN|nr:fatty acid--CoA ligase family protein [Saccharopolyspora erythraea]PFG94312.1 long-chain acyl-CoA synthetase [Saccharopolyspora erythraea NRRL 2338]QRK91085.1 long-chain fatty acid--CoA ligase [Saccharopolyspora erythraea]CAM00519.1 acyl-CoA synthase [Saccharopolyspora erythraea NRRL 2338]